MKLYINANRTGYSPCQIQHTMTVGELIAALEEFDADTPVFLKHDGGYTYGGITWSDLDEGDDDDEQAHATKSTRRYIMKPKHIRAFKVRDQRFHLTDRGDGTLQMTSIHSLLQP